MNTCSCVVIFYLRSEPHTLSRKGTKFFCYEYKEMEESYIQTLNLTETTPIFTQISNISCIGMPSYRYKK